MSRRFENIHLRPARVQYPLIVEGSMALTGLVWQKLTKIWGQGGLIRSMRLNNSKKV